MESNNRCQTKYNVTFVILVSLITFISLSHAILFVYVVVYVKDNANTLITNVVSDVEKRLVELSNDITKQLQSEMSNQFALLNYQINTLLTQQLTQLNQQLTQLTQQTQQLTQQLTQQQSQQQSQQALFALKMNNMLSEIMMCTCNLTQ